MHPACQTGAPPSRDRFATPSEAGGLLDAPMTTVFDDLLKSIESDLNVARRDLEARLGPIRTALDSYERAVLEQRTLDYCQAHSLRRPKTAGIPASAAARALLHLVRSLPELGATVDAAANEQSAPVENRALELAPPEEAPEAATHSPVDEITARFAAKFPSLTRAAEDGRLLVFGAFSGRTKTLPGPLADVTDWIDTATDGNRLVAAAVRRITSGGVFGIIICDQAISHQHSDPAVRAARSHKIPIAYAGKGGNASLARAFETLEEALN